MLRKDVKVGFVVGGILIATLIAYVMVAGKGKPQKVELAEGEAVQQVQPVGSEAPVLPAAEEKKDATPAAPVTPTPAASETASAQKTSDPFQPAQSGKDVWASALNSGTVLMSVTPSAPVAATSTPTEPAAANLAAATKDAKETVPSLLGDSPSTQPSAVTHVVPPVNTTPRVTTSGRTHVVQKGETLTMISIAAYGDQKYWKQIAAANSSIDANKLKPGMTINLPDIGAKKELIAGPLNGGVSVPVNSKTEYEVQSGDSLHRIAQKLYGKDAMWEKIYELNKATIGSNPAKLKLHMKLKLPVAPTQRV